MRVPKLLAVILTAVLTFALPVVASAQTVTTLYSFRGLPSGAAPTGPLAQGRDGWLYGTTLSGGVLNYGTAYKISTTGRSKMVYTFDRTHGANPNMGVMLATNGKLYGTAPFGGVSDFGVLFEITKPGSATLLHDFTGGYDEQEPWGAPVEASDGNLYGAVNGGQGLQPGAAYKLTKSGVFSTIHNFVGSDGFTPQAPLIQAADGTLYGTAYYGGVSNCGTVFSLTVTGIVETVYSFPCGVGGENPSAPVVQASDGNFYGTTQFGGTYGLGTVFEITQEGILSIIHSFGNGSDGAVPTAGLIQGTDGNLYGVTAGGGDGYGAIYEISLSGEYNVLYSFPQLGSNSNPEGSLIQHTNGLFYGTTAGGQNTDPFGSVYSLDMGLGPFVAFVIPAGKVGRAAQILGQGLTGTTNITFSGVPATSFTVVSDTYMTAVVPSGATTGPVVVTTAAGVLTGNKNFRVIQ